MPDRPTKQEARRARTKSGIDLDPRWKEPRKSPPRSIEADQFPLRGSVSGVPENVKIFGDNMTENVVGNRELGPGAADSGQIRDNAVVGPKIAANVFVPNVISRVFARDSIRSDEAAYIFANGAMPWAKVSSPAKFDPTTHGADAHVSGMKAQPTKHGNDAHSPEMAAKKHKHSMTFYETPQIQRQAVIDNRAWLRNQWAAAPAEEKLEKLRHFALQLSHFLLNQPDETAEQIHARLAGDPAYRDVLANKQTIEQDDELYYHVNPGVDDGGGTPGLKPTGLTWETELTWLDVYDYTIEEVG